MSGDEAAMSTKSAAVSDRRGGKAADRSGTRRWKMHAGRGMPLEPMCLEVP